MSKTYAPGEHPEQQRYLRENPTREQIIDMLDRYDQHRIMPFIAGLDERLQWLETPIWERAWIVASDRCAAWFKERGWRTPVQVVRGWWNRLTSDEEEQDE